jgi:uncharacterized paraquat-inducible protein A
MNGSDEKKNNDDKNADKIKKQIEKLQVCPYCQGLVEFIWVHGHYQCPRCKNVVVSCCGDS